MDPTNLSTRFASLLAEGKTQEEALATIVAEAARKTSTPRKDNLSYIRDLRDIPEVRRVKKIAYAKISKSKGKTEAIARYQEEIKVCDEKLNELLGEVNRADIPWEKAMELGEDAKGAFQYYLTSYKDKVDKEVDEKAKKLTQAQLKAKLLETPITIPSELPEIFKETATERTKNGDMMLITVFRKVAFLKSLEK